MSQPANAPPVIVAKPRSLHPVYGQFPHDQDGYAIEDQPLYVLDRWHVKANDLLKPWNEPGDITEEQEAYFQEIHREEWKIYDAAIAVRAKTSRELALQLTIIARHLGTNCGNTCEFLEIKTLADMAKAGMQLSERPRPTKRIGALSRGKKLTRSGLLLRYHAFLVGELKTLGIAFYGTRDYPQFMIPIDHAVNVRTSVGFKNGKYDPRQNGRKHYPFFDESKLPARALSVLKSLKIDTELAETRPKLPKSKRVSYDDACKKAETR
ncbi:hypothetical protein [Tardiphaga sp. 803_E3_N1_3]|uniref:hypothetical protein n=1 Tax=Tardiphaga sp. 803_E3_N1_3 TaxID=3240785 RepID=UPI003F21DAA6